MDENKIASELNEALAGMWDSLTEEGRTAVCVMALIAEAVLLWG